MKRSLALLVFGLAFSVHGPVSNSTTLEAPPARSGFVAEFNPSEGKLPFPDNLLFNGSTDGTLNIPVANPANLADPRVALNALDGFSTVAPITAHFSSTLDPATIAAGATVRLFEVNLANPFQDPGVAPFTVKSVQRELTPDLDYAANLSPLDPNQTTLVITPLRPLKPKTGYLVVLTDGIRGTDGFAPLPDLTYILTRGSRPLLDGSGSSLFRNLTDAEAQTLEPIRSMVNSQEDAAAIQGIARGSIVLSWTFTTQSTADVLVKVRSEAIPRSLQLSATGLSTAQIVPGLPGIADIYVGTLELPYYLDRNAPLTGHWQGNGDSELTQYNPLATATEILKVPVLLTMPNSRSGHSKPPAGWPCLIFQHGITQDRTNLLAIADTLAAVGIVGIAIDLPLHGITDSGNPFYDVLHERTLNLDLVNNETLLPPGDGLIDPSGTHFINLSSLLTTRDNLRQAVADLVTLTATLPTVDIDGDALPDLDTRQAGFVGYSLGGIAGGTFLGLENRITAATMAMAGGGLAKLFDGSASYGPVLENALAAKGLVKGTPDYEAFLNAAQTVFDAGDPVNYAVAAAALHPLHMIEVVGGAGSLPDQVVPNSVTGAPLSGTEPLARLMNLSPISATTTNAEGIRGIVRFIEGTHSSLLDPKLSPAVTAEMQSQTASFMSSVGTLLTIANPDVILQWVDF
jgi:hypothetical protein